MLVSRSVVGLLLLAALSVMPGCSTDGGEGDLPLDRPSQIAALTANLAAGAASYETNCLVCHAKDGKGDSGPNLVSGTAAALPTKAMASVILNGKGSMGAYDSLTNQEVADIIGHVMTTLAGN
ncbi:MAG: cytochrome c [Myxococcales bacterium]|nr:cytochrome c [Myxococcales bacterium]